jgi:hypothetical protein
MDERSTTDLFTNRTVFSSAQLLEKLPELIDPLRAPPGEFLPTFLHEATHHWCFSSPVGTAIALLSMRGRVNALRAVEARSPREAKGWEKRAADDIVRAAVASLLLQPLAEGMATFAEFDLTASLRSPVVPPPLSWAMMFSARDKLTGTRDTRLRRRMDMAQSTAGQLTSARSAGRSRRAKEALLAGPLSCDSGSGYLAGYMLIKALWMFMQRHHERFHEPEVFLLKVYKIFYRDPEFVRLLLDPSRSIAEALNPLAPHLVTRLKYAFWESKDDLHDFYESLISTRAQLYQDGEADGAVLPFADPVDDDPTKRFLAMWDEIMGGPLPQLVKGGDLGPLTYGGITAMHMIGHGRDFLELGSLPAKLDPAKTETVVEVEGRPVARLPTFKAHTGKSSGSLHILLNTRSGEHVVAAISDQQPGEVAALQRTFGSADFDAMSLKRSVMGRTKGVDIASATLAMARKGLEQLTEFKYIDGYVQQTRERLNGLYVTFATDHVPESKIYQLLPKMMTDGMYGAFDYNADLVRALAIMGSTAHVYHFPEHLKSEFDEQALDYESLVQKLREYSESTKLFWLSEHLGVVRSSL